MFISNNDGEVNFKKANLFNLSCSYAALYLLEISLIGSVGTQENLESFYNDSKLFIKKELTTSKEIDEMFKD